MDLTLTIAIFAAAAALFAFGSWRSAQPADPLKPRLVPWRLVVILSGVVGILMLAHVVNLFGIETGGRNGMR
jgi:amino acid transporter